MTERETNNDMERALDFDSDGLLQHLEEFAYKTKREHARILKIYRSLFIYIKYVNKPTFLRIFLFTGCSHYILNCICINFNKAKKYLMPLG